MRIGILGGTFDPIHFGHIRPALEVKQQLNLDTIWLMPNHIPPHKQQTRVSSQHRLEMVELVCRQFTEFSLCDIEAKRDTPSYSVTTLKQLTKQHPKHEFYFIMGTDSLLSLPEWYQWQSLFELCNIVVCQRNGWKLNPQHQINSLYQQRKTDPCDIKAHSVGQIIPVKITPQPFSSTAIRSELLSGALPKNAVPQSVLEYIQRHNLYR